MNNDWPFIFSFCLFKIQWRKLVDAVFLDRIPDREVFIVKVPSVLTKIDQVLAETHPRYEIRDESWIWRHCHQIFITQDTHEYPVSVINLNRILANYLMFRIAFSALPQLGKKWRKLTEKYDKVLTGKSIERPRWDTCMRRLYGTFGVPMSALYVNHHFDPESLEKVCSSTISFHKTHFSFSLTVKVLLNSSCLSSLFLKLQSTPSRIHLLFRSLE